MRLKTLRAAVCWAVALFFCICGYIYICISLTDGPTSISKNVLIVQPTATQQIQLEVTKGVDLYNESTYTPANARTYIMEKVYEEIPFKNEPGGVWKQGFPISYTKTRWQSNPLEVFIVPHSHQDPGWLKTFDDYYVNNSRRSLYSTLLTLKSHPEARFIYSEISFFSRWYEDLSDVEQHDVKRLLHSGQWEIATGGWVMADEAVSHHYAIIEQLIEGHHWLLEKLGYVPTKSWSIDPFGHSSTMAYLTHKMGMTAMVVGRVHYEVKKYLAQRNAFEFYWQQPWDTDGHSRILTHMLAFFSYDIPHTCGPDPSVCCQFDFLRMYKYGCPWHINPKAITEKNVAERAAALADQYHKKATLYNDGTAVLVPLGDDFRYQTESEWNTQLTNYKKLIEYWDKHPEFGIKAMFTTLSDYFSAISRQIHGGAQFPNLVGDFFTYADVNHDYWSGYFTSRPWQKALTRQLETELSAADILYTATRQRITISQHSEAADLLNGLESLSKLTLTTARRQMGLFQHHDGVTGTEHPHVAVDYSRRMLTALDLVRLISSVCIINLIGETNSLKLIHQAVASIQSTEQLSDLLPISSLEDDYVIEDFPEPSPKTLKFVKGEQSNRTVYIFNSLSRSRNVMVRLPRVHLDMYEEIPLIFAYQVSNAPRSKVDTEYPLGVQLTTNYPTSDSSPINTIAMDIGPIRIPPMTLQRIDLKIDAKRSNTAATYSKLIFPTMANGNKQIHLPGEGEEIHLQSNGVTLTFSKRTGLLKKFSDSQLEIVLDLSIDFRVYGSGESKSGAYLFVPNGEDRMFEITDNASVVVTKGNLHDELKVVTPTLVHTVRLHKQRLHRLPYFEIENTVRLRSQTLADTELVMRVSTNLTDGAPIFYTDSNCFQFMKRKYLNTIPLQGNLYPVTCATFIQHQSSGADKSVTRLNLFTSHSAGVTSTAPGELRIWLDRRSKSDDRRGLASPLAGEWTATSKFRVVIERLPCPPPDTVPSLSLDAQHLQLDFSTPLQRFSVNKQRSQLAQLSLLSEHVDTYQQSIPCDYHVTSMRTLHTRMPDGLSKDLKLPIRPANVGILLRRFAPLYQPLTHGEDSGLHCVPSQSTKLNTTAVFGPLKFDRARLTGLTFVPRRGSSWHPELHVEPMELQAYLLDGDGT